MSKRTFELTQFQQYSKPKKQTKSFRINKPKKISSLIYATQGYLPAVPGLPLPLNHLDFLGDPTEHKKMRTVTKVNHQQCDLSFSRQNVQHQIGKPNRRAASVSSRAKSCKGPYIFGTFKTPVTHVSTDRLDRSRKKAEG